jgi:hypothetical protein
VGYAEGHTAKTFWMEMNCPAVRRGVSVYDKLYSTATSCGDLNPVDFAISNPHSLQSVQSAKYVDQKVCPKFDHLPSG